MTQDTCPSCGRQGLVPGVIESTGAVRFRPVATKFLTFRTADVNVQALMCPACGQIVLRGDVQKLQHLSSPPSQSVAAPTP